MALPKIDQGFCERLVTAAINHCASPQAQPASAVASSVQPNFDGLATSFGALSAAFTWGTIVLAVIAVIAALSWGALVKFWAEKEAREEAERCAQKIVDAHMRKWLVTEAPQIVRRHVENLADATIGGGNEDAAAENIGKEAG